MGWLAPSSTLSDPPSSPSYPIACSPVRVLAARQLWRVFPSLPFGDSGQNGICRGGNGGVDICRTPCYHSYTERVNTLTTLGEMTMEKIDAVDAAILMFCAVAVVGVGAILIASALVNALR